MTHLENAFLKSGHSKRFTLMPNIHPFMPTFTLRRRCEPRKRTASWSGAVRGRRLAQGHLDAQLGGAGVRTSNLPVTSRPAPPPEPRAVPYVRGSYLVGSGVLTDERLVVCGKGRGVVVDVQDPDEDGDAGHLARGVCGGVRGDSGQLRGRFQSFKVFWLI